MAQGGNTRTSRLRVEAREVSAVAQHVIEVLFELAEIMTGKLRCQTIGNAKQNGTQEQFRRRRASSFPIESLGCDENGVNVSVLQFVTNEAHQGVAVFLQFSIGLRHRTPPDSGTVAVRAGKRARTPRRDTFRCTRGHRL